MKNLRFLLLMVLMTSITTFGQQKPESKKITITGKIIEKNSKLPLEYATVSFKNSKNPKLIFGGITDGGGEYNIDVIPGVYDITLEFISFKPLVISQKQLSESTNLGTTYLEDDATQLKEVVVTAEKSSVEIKLDKKVYNVGQDLTAKGGTASDVLDNVPSVTVDGDGNVSLRGNDNVKIFIDGRPATAINISDALKSIPADSLEKIEIISNPSARYDAESSAGIINIILKKGKNQGINGTISITAGDPRNYNTTEVLNFKTKQFNLFSSFGYSDSESRGRTLNNTQYLDNTGNISKTIDEQIERRNGRRGFNYGFGTDWFLDKSTTWTNSFSYRKANGYSPTDDNLVSNDANIILYQNRFTNQFTKTQDLEYNSTFIKNFKKDGHVFSIIFNTSKNTDNDYATISNSFRDSTSGTTLESTNNLQNQSRNLLQVDYTLPIGKNSKIETGYKGDFNSLLTNYNVGSIDSFGNYTPYTNYTNVFDYREKFNAVYAQFGSTVKKFSYLLGLRFEDSNIDINLITTNDFTNKKYTNFFPSAFLNYSLNEKTTFSLNYSKKIARPRNRFLTPFSNYSSNINIFVGNPNINPSITDAFELSILKKYDKATVTASLYYNRTSAPFQFIRRPNGEVITAVVNGQNVSTPVTIATPVNLDTDNRIGFEFNANYSPYKWWKLNMNFNFFSSQVKGDYQYNLLGSNQIVKQSTNISASSWFAKLNSRFSLPFKIDCQTNATYNAPQNTAQGKTLGILAANLAFSKDVLKDKATLTLNINDVFNSRKRISQTNIASLNSYNEMQMRVRQINLTFLYRFNKQKTPKEKQNKKNQSDDNEGGDF
ncbi:outer membrane beta-barrel family protein [Flavobacterium sp.]|uniref:outer membrane beta-barrel family protein n=1 Tax=Flavobacterium sp. TaxID=239 RepID=UPI0025F9CDC9|nr:outer membrane beta-barrel family protein [Flavobacterium sp.]